MDFNDSKTWDLFKQGRTKGVFQLESNLGKSWSKKLQPSNIEELSALIAIIRPGVLKSSIDGKSLANHYVDRKLGKDKVDFFHPALEEPLKQTYGVLCIHEDTMISLTNGEELPIKEIGRRDKLNYICQQTLKCRKAECLDVCISPKTEGYKITLENGWSIVLTGDHKVYTLDGPIEVKHLNTNSIVQFVARQTSTQKTKQLPYYSGGKWAYLCGQLVGDGASGQNICSGTDDNHKKLIQYLKQHFSEDLCIGEYFNVRSNYISIGGKHLLNHKSHGNRKTIYRKFIETLGLEKTKHDKVIPTDVMTGDDEIRRMFLAGLFDADGHSGVSTNGGGQLVTYCTTNKYVLEQIRKLLSIDGITCYLDAAECHIHVNNTRAFYELIGPYIILKKAVGKLSDGLKIGSYPKKYLKSHILNKGCKIKAYCRDAGLSDGVLFHNNHATIGTAKKLGVDTGDTIMMKVKSIVPVKDQRFYSISVSQQHTLIGNGIVISNCYQEQTMLIAKQLAGFSLQEADELRKAIGKKKADLMAKIRIKFIDKAEALGIVKRSEAEQIFDWIEKSARYQFNKCLSPDTMVITRNGRKRLEDLRVGDFVLAPNKDRTANEFVEVIDVIYNGMKQLYLAKTDSGQSITCTLDHKFLCVDGTVRELRDIVNGEHEILTINLKSSKFVSHKRVGVLSSMDIEVASDSHVFYGDEIATSNSHSVSYAVNAYMSAWYKANHTKEFFIASLYFAGDKQNPHREIYELVSEAKLFDIDIRVPDLTHFTEKFAWSNGKIYFGIKDIKSLTGVGGDKLLSQIKEASIAADKSPENLSWMDVLIYISPKVSSTVFKTLASIGFFSTKSTNVSRNKALFEYAIFKQLSNGERDWVIQKYRERKWATLKECLLALAPSKKRGGGTSKPDRETVILDEVKLIENPPYDLTDEPAWIIDQEVKFLGCPITLSKIDAVDTSASNITCKDIVNGRMGDDICLAANIVRYSPYKIKDGKNKGKTMAFLTLEDETCAIDNVVIFSEAREKYEMVLYEGNNLLFCGVVNKDGFVINKIHEI